jgi:hypothetical protein
MMFNGIELCTSLKKYVHAIIGGCSIVAAIAIIEDNHLNT